MTLLIAAILSLVFIAAFIISLKVALKTKSLVSITATILSGLGLIAFLGYTALTVLFVNSIK